MLLGYDTKVFEYRRSQGCFGWLCASSVVHVPTIERVPVLSSTLLTATQMQSVYTHAALTVAGDRTPSAEIGIAGFEKLVGGLVNRGVLTGITHVDVERTNLVFLFVAVFALLVATSSLHLLLLPGISKVFPSWWWVVIARR